MNIKIKIMIIISIFLVVSGLSYSSYYYNSIKVGNKRYLQLSAKQKLEDFDYAYDILKDNFPYFEIEKRKTDYDWLAHKQEFENEIKQTKNDYEFYIKMSEIIKKVQNGHTRVVSPLDYQYDSEVWKCLPLWNKVVDKEVEEKYKYWRKLLSTNLNIYFIPIEFKYIEGKYVVNENNFEIPAGSYLRMVNGINIDNYVKELSDKKYLYYDYKSNKLYTDYPLISDDKDINLTFKTQQGKEINKKISAQVYNPYKASNLNSEESNTISTKILENNKIAYIKINSMEFDYKSYHETMHKFYEQIKDYPDLIIDIRGNGGGGDPFWEYNVIAPLENKDLVSKNFILFKDGEYIKPVINEKIADKIITPINDKQYLSSINASLRSKYSVISLLTYKVPKFDTVNFKGKIYLLVDRDVYSAAEGLAVFAKDTKFATLIGTTTGGDGIGFDPVPVKLPNSGLIFQFTMDCGLNPDDTSNEETHTKPDIYVEQTYSDYLKSIEWKKHNRQDSINPYDTILNRTLEIIDTK